MHYSSLIISIFKKTKQNSFWKPLFYFRVSFLILDCPSPQKLVLISQKLLLPSPAPNQSSAGRASSGPAQTVHIPGPATDHRRGIPWPTDTACRALPTVAQRARGWACCRFPPPPPMGPPQGLLPTASLCDQSRAAPAGLGCPTRQQGLLPSGVDLRHLHPLCPGVTPAHGPAEPHSLAPGHPWSSGDVNGGQPGQRRPSRGRTLTYPLPVVTLNPRGDWRTARCSAHQGGHLSMRM